MRAGRRGVIVSNIAVTNCSEKKTTTKKNKKNFLRQVRIAFFLFLAADWTAGDDMPTVYDVQTTTRKDLERAQRDVLKVLYSGLELATEIQHNITTSQHGIGAGDPRKHVLSHVGGT
jgi:hypothetical protein